jgi:hypothetical protein
MSIQSENIFSSKMENKSLKSFRKVMERGNFEDIERILNLNQITDEYSEQSLLAIALKLEQFDIYELPISKGFFLHPHENIEEIVKNFPIETKKKIRDIHKKPAKLQNLQHLLTLNSRSKLSHDATEDKKRELFEVIDKTFKTLNDIKWIESVLKIVACADELTIIFDFDRDSVVNMDPTANKFTKGLCYHGRGDVYIGAFGLLNESDEKKFYKTLAVVAHELSHYAIQLIYQNQCKPFCYDDLESFDKFDEMFCEEKS